MSLAVKVDAGGTAGAQRITLAVGGLMTAALVMAAWEPWQEGLAARHWLLPLIAAVACAAACLVQVRRRRRRPVSLRIGPDGRLKLLVAGSAEAVDVEVVMTWGLGRLIYLRVRPMIKVDSDAPAKDGRESDAATGMDPCSSGACAFCAGDCRFLLVRRYFSETDWHGLRRWLVWYRRSGHGGPVAA